MTQFDVFANPNARSRAIYPYVVNLQSDVSSGRSDRIVAPLALRSKFPSGGRLFPVVRMDERDYVVATSALTAIPSIDLKRRLANLSAFRSDLLGAIDLLFFGI